MVLFHFLLMTIIAFSSFVKILIYWWKTNNIKGLPLFLFYISVFTLSEIILARSFLYPYIWMSIGGISAYFFNKKEEK